MKEIGGYFELERFPGNEYHSDLLRLNLGRTALLYLLKCAEAHTLWVPYFLCEAVTSTCQKAGYHLNYYHIDRNFLPILDEKAINGTYAYLVNFYGQLTEDTILALKRKYKHVILDNTHAFFQKPPESIPTLYSIRKFFGLSDGAYVSVGNLPERISVEQLEQDSSCARMEHILGRFEHSASAYYQTMLRNAHALDEELVLRMSPLTENLLHGIDYTYACKTREDNYRKLEELLGSQNPLPIHMPKGPFVYPFYHKNGRDLRLKLAQHKIFIPTYWNNVLRDMPHDSLEYDYAANILPLPCDQRYTTDDMTAMARQLKEYLMLCEQ